MGEARKAGGWLHFGSPLNMALSMLFTMLISFAVAPFKDTGPGNRLSYLYDIINRRGPAVYVMFFICFAVAIPLAVEQRTRKEATITSILALCFAALGPFLVGLIGSLQGIGSVNAQLGSMLRGATDLQDLVTILGKHATNQAIIMDIALLGLVQTILLLFPAMSLLNKKENVQQAGGAYVSPATGETSAHP